MNAWVHTVTKKLMRKRTPKKKKRIAREKRIKKKPKKKRASARNKKIDP